MKKKLRYDCFHHLHFFLIVWLPALLGISNLQAGSTLFSSGTFPVSVNQKFVGPHYRVFCFENSNPTPQNTPLFSKDTNLNYQITYTDQIYDLTLAAGFEGFFDLARWQKTFGDGGVDVTGAPNVALVEGANAALVKVTSRQMVKMEIEIPAEGFVKFDWRKVGGSYFSFEIKAANERFHLDRGLNGHYISPLLRPGDQVSLSFSVPVDSLIHSELQLENFRFYSNSASVIARTWEALDEEDVTVANFTQYISVEMPELNKINFPEPLHISESTAIFHAEYLTPEITGFPYFDADGNPETKDDQYVIEHSNCAFDVKWEDELIMEEDKWTLMRHWLITDPVYKNEIKRTQVIKLYASAEEEPSHLEDPPLGTVLRQKPTIRFRDMPVKKED